MAGARGAAVTNNYTTNVGGITIVQKPGQDTRALAREVGAELKRQEAVAGRSRLYDGPAQ